MIQTWWEILGHLHFSDAMNGLLAHRRESTEYVQPAHIIAQARRAKRERLRVQQAAIEPKAITGAIPMPSNFRQMVAEAAGMEYVHTTVEPEVEQHRRAAARAELSNITATIGAMP